jgi:predicted transcriptional regulator
MKQPVTVALSADVRAGLDHFAAAQDRSRSWIADQALKEWFAARRNSPEVSRPLAAEGAATSNLPNPQPNQPHPAAA